MVAAQKGQIDVVKQLLSDGTEVNEPNWEGETALMWASENGHLEIVELLIQTGADIKLKTKYGWTALLYAVCQNRLKIAGLLIAEGSELETKGGGIGGYKTTPLEQAALGGYPEMVELLIKSGAKVSGENCYPLEMAAVSGDLEIIKYLLSNGADINERSDKSHPLGAAAEYGHLEIVKFLLANGADINLQSRKTLRTALMEATRCEQSEIIKFLIDAGANIDEEDSGGWTALMRAKILAKYPRENDIIKQFPNRPPDLTNYIYNFDFYWSKKLLLPICAKCFVPFQILASEKGELSVFRCPFEARNYSLIFYNGRQLTLSEGQEFVAEIIEENSEGKF